MLGPGLKEAPRRLPALVEPALPRGDETPFLLLTLGKLNYVQLLVGMLFVTPRENERVPCRDISTRCIDIGSFKKEYLSGTLVLDMVIGKLAAKKYRHLR